MGPARICAGGTQQCVSLPRSFDQATASVCIDLRLIEQPDVQVSFGRPRGAGDVPEPGRGEV